MPNVGPDNSTHSYFHYTNNNYNSNLCAHLQHYNYNTYLVHIILNIAQSLPFYPKRWPDEQYFLRLLSTLIPHYSH